MSKDRLSIDLNAVINRKSYIPKRAQSALIQDKIIKKNSNIQVKQSIPTNNKLTNKNKFISKTQSKFILNKRKESLHNSSSIFYQNIENRSKSPFYKISTKDE